MLTIFAKLINKIDLAMNLATLANQQQKHCPLSQTRIDIFIDYENDVKIVVHVYICSSDGNYIEKSADVQYVIS